MDPEEPTVSPPSQPEITRVIREVVQEGIRQVAGLPPTPGSFSLENMESHVVEYVVRRLRSGTEFGGELTQIVQYLNQANRGALAAVGYMRQHQLIFNFSIKKDGPIYWQYMFEKGLWYQNSKMHHTFKASDRWYQIHNIKFEEMKAMLFIDYEIKRIDEAYSAFEHNDGGKYHYHNRADGTRSFDENPDHWKKSANTFDVKVKSDPIPVLSSKPTIYEAKIGHTIIHDEL